MHGRAAPIRKAPLQGFAQDPYGDSEIPRPTDEVLSFNPATSPVLPSDDTDHRSEFWHG